MGVESFDIFETRSKVDKIAIWHFPMDFHE